jgi:Secretion system C-terminal sorting domain
LSGTTTRYANSVDLDWDDVEGAIGYIVEVSSSQIFGFSVSIKSNTSNLTLNTTNTAGMTSLLSANRNLFWRIKAYGAYKTCTPFSGASNFMTGTDILSSNTEIEGVEDVMISPNPLSISSILSLNINNSKDFEATIKIFDAVGRLLKTEKRHFQSGRNVQNISVSGLNNGLFILQIENELGRIERRFVVQD